MAPCDPGFFRLFQVRSFQYHKQDRSLLKEILMKHLNGAHTHERMTPVPPPLCSHHFHVVHVDGRAIPGIMVCESCGQRIMHRKKTPTTDVH